MGWARAIVVASLAGLAATSEFWVNAVGAYHWSFGPVVFLLAFGAQAFAIPKRQRFEREKKRYLLGRIFDDGAGAIKDAADPSLRLNIMILGREKRPTGEMSGGKEKKTFFKRRCLVYLFRHGFEPTDPDATLTIFEDQGVAGAALRYGQFAYGRREVGQNGRIFVDKVVELDDINHNMSQSQRAQAGALQLILSYPIRGLKQHGTDVEATGDIIGVVNVDSRIPLTDWVARHPQKYADLSQRVLPRLAEATAYVLT